MTQQEELSALLAAPYEVGGVLTRRRVVDCSTEERSQNELFRVKIKKLQQPWTLSCGMVVDILSDTFTGEDQHKTTPTTNATQTAFLKLHDWRFAPQLRDDHGIDPWNEEFAAAYAQFALAGGGEERERFLRRLEEDE
jgi:hypothetical protein